MHMMVLTPQNDLAQDMGFATRSSADPRMNR